jgi:hypothetical protein
MAYPSSTSSSAVIDESQRSRSRNMIGIAFLVISALYFADTLLRASLKTFWYDELITVLLCRLPSFSSTWSAVLQGADFNPPLFYLLSRLSQHLFGEGLIACRLPAIVGFWLFALCLFFFVRRRLGTLGGLVAAMFPIFTLAHTYAYEARAHGAILGWAGLMLLTWQRAREGRAFSAWTIAFALSWLAALLTHVYAIYLLVPFLIVEGLALTRRWRLHTGILAALLLVPACIAPLYLHMSRTYRANTSVGGLHIHPYEVIQQYLVAIASPALAILLFAFLALSIDRMRPQDGSATGESPHLLPAEWWLAVGFACLPIIGAIGVKLSHGPFFNRYFLASTSGYAILLAQAVSSRTRGALAAKALVAAMLFLLVGDTGIAAYCKWHHADLDQVEPASHFAFPPNPKQPLSRDHALLNNHDAQPILVPNDHTYLYLYYYGSPALRARLYLGLPRTSDFPVSAYQREAQLLQTPDMRTVGIDDFAAAHPDFFVYSALDAKQNGTCFDCLQIFLDRGYSLRSVDRDADNLIEHFTR